MRYVDVLLEKLRIATDEGLEIYLLDYCYVGIVDYDRETALQALENGKPLDDEFVAQ